MAKQGKYARSPEPKQSKSIFFGKTKPKEKAEGLPAPELQRPAATLQDKEVKHPEESLTPRQKLWNTVITVASNLIMVLSVAMMLFTAVSTRTLDQNDRDLFGFKFFIVRSDSMSATDFSAGDLVVIREVDPGTLAEGDIIAFSSDDPNTLGETYTHKIRSFTTDDFGARTFVTYGTTTGVDDTYPVPQNKILGQYQFAIPNMGTFFAFMKTPMGYICCIGIPFLFMLFIQGGGMIASARRLYKEKEEKIEAEHQAELAAQQKTIDGQRAAMRKLFQTVNSLQERVEALEKEKNQSL